MHSELLGHCYSVPSIRADCPPCTSSPSLTLPHTASLSDLHCLTALYCLTFTLKLPTASYCFTLTLTMHHYLIHPSPHIHTASLPPCLTLTPSLPHKLILPIPHTYIASMPHIVSLKLSDCLIFRLTLP